VEWPLLGDLPPDEVRELTKAMRRRTFSRGEIVFHERDPAESMHLVVKGRFAVRVTTALGDVALLAVIGAGEVFGELALLSEGAKRSATVAALEAAETRSLFRDDFVRLQHRHPHVNQVLLRLVAEQLRRTNDRLVEAHYVDADTRVLRRLRDLARIYASGDGETTIPLTQEELAQMAGTSRATVNRVLGEAQRREEIALRRGKIVLLEPAGLVKRAG
jgi:CRP-like cAMP-binding protein